MNERWDHVALFRKVLELCKLKTDETLIVLTEGGDRPLDPAGVLTPLDASSGLG